MRNRETVHPAHLIALCGKKKHKGEVKLQKLPVYLPSATEKNPKYLDSSQNRFLRLFSSQC